jgi:pyruvate dehydrogenase E1 component beta subunit
MEHETFFHLDAPVWRVCGVDGPMPYAKTLEQAALPQTGDVVHAVNKVLGVK